MRFFTFLENFYSYDGGKLAKGSNKCSSVLPLMLSTSLFVTNCLLFGLSNSNCEVLRKISVHFNYIYIYMDRYSWIYIYINISVSNKYINIYIIYG